MGTKKKNKTAKQAKTKTISIHQGQKSTSHAAAFGIFKTDFAFIFASGVLICLNS